MAGMASIGIRFGGRQTFPRSSKGFLHRLPFFLGSCGVTWCTRSQTGYKHCGGPNSTTYAPRLPLSPGTYSE
jgi:hypothetical protein